MTSNPLTFISVGNFSLGPGVWAMIRPADRPDVLRAYVQHARKIIAESGLSAPESLRLELIVMLAVEAEYLFFSAALHDPSPEDRDLFFANFVLGSLIPSTARFH